MPSPGSPEAPKYWMHETGGELAVAVKQYLEDPHAMTIRHIVLMRAYIRQWIDSPAWDQNPHMTSEDRAVLQELRASATRLSSARDISRWLRDALREGHDPL